MVHENQSDNQSNQSDTWLPIGAVQVGWLTPLTFAQHRLSPVHTFSTMESNDTEFANFTLLTLKAFLEVHSQNVSGNKQ